MHSIANILGFSFFSKQKFQLLTEIENCLTNSDSTKIIFTPNAEQIVQARQNPKLSRYLQQADWLIPDGISLVWSSRLLSMLGRSKIIQQRISGIDLAQDLLNISRQQQLPILLVGGRDYQQLIVNSKERSAVKQSQAAEQQSAVDREPRQNTIQPSQQEEAKLPLQQKDELWQLADNLFWTPGYRQITQPQEKEEQRLRQQLLNLKPAIVLAAFGAPEQEEWAIEHLPLLNQAEVKLVMSVGGAFDVIFNQLQRAPVWMRKSGLEWLFRLLQEPWRWKRQTRLIKFVSLVIQQAVKGENL